MGILSWLLSKKNKPAIAFISGSSVYKEYSHFYNPDECFTADFYHNLLITINHTHNIFKGIEVMPAADCRRILRTVNPQFNGELFYTYDDTVDYPSVSSICHPFNYQLILEDCLKLRCKPGSTTGDFNQHGKILRFYNDISTCDGAPCAATLGFVDEGDIPPLDTWFYVTETFLYCWIPNAFLPIMEEAIAVEILGSYHWLEDIAPEFNCSVFERLKDL